MNRKDFLVTAAGVAATLAASTAALAQTTTTPPTQKPTRGEAGSARNLKRVRYMLERLIDELQHDQRDYGGGPGEGAGPPPPTAGGHRQTPPAGQAPPRTEYVRPTP